jgi:glycosyltransferase involved in cell wall biosynthesis
MPKVSVIIPCYNQGQYLNEAVQSVLTQTCDDFEIIIVNDGSTDGFTNDLLFKYNGQKIKVLHTANHGLSEARNQGIRASTGRYILPLDADDKIGAEYLSEAIKVLDADPETGIVYCEAEYFGEKTGKWDLPPYSIEKMLRENQIFCSAFFRRVDYDATCGYNPNMVHGWEDWDFWLSLLELGKKVHRIPRILFYYRIRAESMVRALDEENYVFLRKRVYRNHLALYAQEFQDPINLSRENGILRKELAQLYNSKDYKIGNRIMEVLRFVKKGLKI